MPCIMVLQHSKNLKFDDWLSFNPLILLSQNLSVHVKIWLTEKPVMISGWLKLFLTGVKEQNVSTQKCYR